MIPYDIKAGSFVICIDDTVKSYGVTGHPTSDDLGGLKKHQVYTVEKVSKNDKTANGYAVKLKEIPRRIKGDLGFDIGRFKAAVLPETITKWLISGDRNI